MIVAAYGRSVVPRGGGTRPPGVALTARDAAAVAVDLTICPARTDRTAPVDAPATVPTPGTTDPAAAPAAAPEPIDAIGRTAPVSWFVAAPTGRTFDATTFDGFTGPV